MQCDIAASKINPIRNLQQKGEVVTYISLWTLQLDTNRLNEGLNVDLSPCAALVQIQVDNWSTQLEKKQMK